MPLGTLPEKDFFGRKEELLFLYNKALELQKSIAENIFLSGRRGIGKTELLKQLFNHLFWAQETTAPFYYFVNNALLSVSDFSRDYLTQYLCQRLAFEKKESSLLNIEGLSIKGIYSLAEERRAGWACEILDRYINTEEPLDSLRLALGAPYHASLSTGMPAVIMIDNFQMLNNLYLPDKAVSADIVYLLEKPIKFLKTQYVITGNQAEIQEMPLSAGFVKIEVQPLSIEDASAMFSSILDKYGNRTDLIPSALINHLGGNPLYISAIAKNAGIRKRSEDKDFWKVYIDDIMAGRIHSYWITAIKKALPDMSIRREILEGLHRIYHAGEPFSRDRIPGRYFSDNKYAEKITKALYLSGLVSGEFGSFRAPQDRVLTDLIDCLYMKEILGKINRDIEAELLGSVSTSEENALSFEMTIPSVKEAELVAAQCLEQIGKNLNLDRDNIEQLQMAVIEACINAIEHSKGDRIYLKFVCGEDRLEISIESSGSEFISPETGEPFIMKGLKEDIGRGWGIKLMRNFTDSVAFERTEKGMRVVLVKNLLRASKTENKDTIG
ncbi:MAG: ATP-binding protein [Nitrospirae bacterium]|nr:ATP-binding protein [Nitrospirota bacterium]